MAGRLRASGAGAASARCVVSVYLHAGHNLGLGRASPPHARVELRLVVFFFLVRVPTGVLPPDWESAPTQLT